MLFEFEGFPTLKMSEKIEVPDIAELLQIPLLHKADIDDAYKYGGENIRRLIDLTPLENDKKYYTVRSQMQFLKPGYCPANTPKWHVDGHDIPVMQSNDRMHILVGDSSNLYTEFLEEPVIAEEYFDISQIDFVSAIAYFEENQHQLGFKPKTIEPNRFVTFSCRHPHRVTTPRIPEFRFFFEIRESDYHRPRMYEEAKRPRSNVFNFSGEPFVSLEHSSQWGVIIRDRY